jgi:hypothetical protein
MAFLTREEFLRPSNTWGRGSPLAGSNAALQFEEKKCMSSVIRSVAPASGTESHGAEAARVRLRPEDDFTVEWCLPALWDKLDAESGPGSGPHVHSVECSNSGKSAPFIS